MSGKLKFVKYELDGIKTAEDNAKIVMRILDMNKKISQRNKTIFVQHYQEGYGVSELARQYNISKQRISQILQNVAKILRQEFEKFEREAKW